ncbi:3'-5' exonuclease [Candidatus Palauibacter sp.]|uniref:3'-5' exonuclease n=1 Tax=Candidatus Palauibacter sp. TaxID=3101350 RepID=UPI003B01586A
MSQRGEGRSGGEMSRVPAVRFAPEGVLFRRAMARLEQGACEARDLAVEMFGIRGGPPGLADRLVAEVLEGAPDVVREGPDGAVWRLARCEAKRAEKRRDGLHQLRYAVVDVETNGGVAGAGGRVVEIAIVEVDRGEIGDCFSTLVDAGVAIPPWITRLTGIRTEMTRGAPSFSQICDQVRERLSGRVFVAHNAGYDWGFLRAEMRRAGAAVPRGPRLCTVHLARRLLPGLDRRGLDAVADYYGIEIRERHRARGDAVATARILVRMLADAERRGWTTWPALRRALARPSRRKRPPDASGPPDESHTGGKTTDHG